MYINNHNEGEKEKKGCGLTKKRDKEGGKKGGRLRQLIIDILADLRQLI